MSMAMFGIQKSKMSLEFEEYQNDGGERYKSWNVIRSVIGLTQIRLTNTNFHLETLEKQ